MSCFFNSQMSPEELKEKLEKNSPFCFDLVLKENRCVFLNVLEKKGKYIRLSLHRLFLYANDQICLALTNYIHTHNRKALSILRDFVEEYFMLNPRKKSSIRRNAKGKVYDLDQIFVQLNQKYFANQLEVAITWIKSPCYKKYSHLTFGSYDYSSQLIRVNQLIDQELFPKYFVHFVVYHEMLHHLIPAYIDGAGRRRFHHSAFRKKEKLFEEFLQAKTFEKNIIKTLRRKRYGRT